MLTHGNMAQPNGNAIEEWAVLMSVGSSGFNRKIPPFSPACWIGGLFRLLRLVRLGGIAGFFRFFRLWRHWRVVLAARCIALGTGIGQFDRNFALASMLAAKIGR
jgi:hypothetical protein